MSALIAEDEIAHEAELVWLEDIGDLDYVRQSLDRLPTRRGKPAYHRDGRMVGYALLGPGAKPSRSSGTFQPARVLAAAARPRYRSRGPVLQRGARRGHRPAHAGAGQQGPQDRALRGRAAVLGDAGTGHNPAVVAPLRHRCSGARLADRRTVAEGIATVRRSARRITA